MAKETLLEEIHRVRKELDKKMERDPGVILRSPVDPIT